MLQCALPRSGSTLRTDTARTTRQPLKLLIPAYLDKVSPLHRRLGEQDTVIGDDTHWITVKPRESCAERRSRNTDAEYVVTGDLHASRQAATADPLHTCDQSVTI